MNVACRIYAKNSIYLVFCATTMLLFVLDNNLHNIGKSFVGKLNTSLEIGSNSHDDKLCIANAFNDLFTGFGPDLASKIITPNGKSYNDYLNTPSDSIFRFSTIEDKNTADIIRSLKTKSSCGYDGLSVKLLKSIETEICSSVTLIIKKSIITGISPID